MFDSLAGLVDGPLLLHWTTNSQRSPQSQKVYVTILLGRFRISIIAWEANSFTSQKLFINIPLCQLLLVSDSKNEVCCFPKIGEIKYNA